MKSSHPNASSKEIEKFHTSMQKKSETSLRNFASVPPKATIRLENMRCGKRNCSKCFQVSDYDYGRPYFYHGPYFCAYWRDNGKLKKKYIGEFNPDLEIRLDINGKRIGVWNPLLKLKKKQPVSAFSAKPGPG